MYEYKTSLISTGSSVLEDLVAVAMSRTSGDNLIIHIHSDHMAEDAVRRCSDVVSGCLEGIGKAPMILLQPWLAASLST